MRITIVLLALLLLSPGLAAAQGDTATPPAAATLAALTPAKIVAALEEAEPPDTLPGNVDEAIELLPWDAYYDAPLEIADGWVMTGSSQFPMATVLVFGSAEAAEAGVGTYREPSSETTAGDLTAWTIADRGKWVCVAVDGPVLFLGQAEPVDTDEDEDVVRERSCEVTAATHDWLLEVTGLAPAATPAP